MKSIRNYFISQQKRRDVYLKLEIIVPSREKYFLPIRNENCLHSSFKVSASGFFRISRVSPSKQIF